MDAVGCLENGASCKSDASIGICCSKFCLVYLRQDTGTCQIQEITPPKTLHIHKSESSSSSLPVILGSIFGVLIVGLVVVILLMWRRMKTNLISKEELYKFFRGNPEEDNSQDLSSDIPAHERIDNMPFDMSYEIPIDKFTINHECILGSGAFGIVKKGTIHLAMGDNPVPVATKMIREDVDIQYFRALLSELKLMTYIGYNDYVVALKGAYTAELRKGITYLFLEFCPLGSLEKFLRTNVEYFVPDTRSYANIRPPCDGDFQTEDLYAWSMQIAKGLDYLSNKKVIHGDLATRNVLLVSKHHIKITDFGLSRRVYEYTNYVKKQQEPLPWKWLAIESLRELSFSTQSDVWSLGVTMWEIFTLGTIPYPGLSWHVDFIQKLTDGLRLPKPNYGSDELYMLLLKCWSLSPKDRPLPRDIVKDIGKMLEQYEYQRRNF